MNNSTAYRCILADPPWYYGRSWDTGSKNALVQTTKAEPMPYEQMKIDEIKALPVGDLAADQCDLYLWVTQKYLPDSFDVLKAWGFRYCQALTWCKVPMGTGQGGLYCPTTEFLILGRRGKMPTGKVRKDSTWWQVKRQKRHSQKPEFFQDMIEMQSDGPRLELFARRKRDGWDSWGNEVESDIIFTNGSKEASGQAQPSVLRLTDGQIAERRDEPPGRKFADCDCDEQRPSDEYRCDEYLRRLLHDHQRVRVRDMRRGADAGGVRGLKNNLRQVVLLV